MYTKITTLSLRVLMFIYLVTYGFSNLQAQVTIGSGEVPERAALLQLKDKKATTIGGATADKGGLLLPRVELEDRLQLFPFFKAEDSATPEYADNKKKHIGLTVYNLKVDKAKDLEEGFYLWNGSKWLLLNNSLPSNGIQKSEAGDIVLGGTLTMPTTINSTDAANGITFSASQAGADFVIDGTANLGVGNAAPTHKLDVAGDAQLDGKVFLTLPENTSVLNNLTTDDEVLYVNRTTSQVRVQRTDKEFKQVVGGYRPGSNFLIKKVDATNSITRISFVAHVDESNTSNNSIEAAYTYGDFTVVGLPNHSLRIVEANIKGFDGSAKTLSSPMSDTLIEWSNLSQGTSSIIVDPATGEIRFKNTAASLSFVFETMGGI